MIQPSDFNSKRKREEIPAKFQTNAFLVQCHRQQKGTYTVVDV